MVELSSGMQLGAVHQFQPVSFGKYLLLQRIGSGGMAEIYRAKAFGPHNFVKEFAIKKILPHLVDDSEFMTMFVDEARIVVNLQHVNIVQVFELGELNGQVYIAMEYVNGKDLLELLARCDAMGVRLPLKLALYIVMEMLKGLEYAHRARDDRGRGMRVVHRDVSPCNILLSYSGEVKLTDFGVAKASTQRTRTESGMLKGKVGYMSPEQISGGKIDRRSDLFSCGVVLFEVLAMRRLFIGPNDLNVMLKIRDGDIDRDMEDLDFLPHRLKEIVAGALGHKRSSRTRSAQALHRQLMDFMFEHSLQVTSDDLGRFMRRIFAQEYGRQSALRKQDPSDISAFPDLQSPQVARYRFREPNGSIVGPMSLETLISILRYRSQEEGNAISVDRGPWVSPESVQEVRELLDELSQQVRGIVSSHHLGLEHRRAQSEEGAAMYSGGVLSPSPWSRGIRRQVRPGKVGVEEGALSEKPFPMLLYSLHEREASGLLSVYCEGVRKEIYIEKGALGYVASNKRDELLGNFLCEHGVIGADQLQVALNRLSEFGGRLGDVLVGQGMLPETELFHYLSLQARQKLLEVFVWEEGRYSYQSDLHFDGESYPLGISPLEILVRGIRSRTPLGSIKRCFEGHMDRVVKVSDATSVHLDQLKLSARELNVAACLRDCESLRRLMEVAQSSPNMKVEEAWRVAFMLHCTRLLVMDAPT